MGIKTKEELPKEFTNNDCDIHLLGNYDLKLK